MVATMTSCGSTVNNSSGQHESLKQLWSKNIASNGYSYLIGEFIVNSTDNNGALIATSTENSEKGWSVKSRIPRFSYGATSDSSYAFFNTEDGDGSLAILDFNGNLKNRVIFPKSNFQGNGFSIGPFIAKDRLFLSHGADILAYNMNDILQAGAKPLWKVRLEGNYLYIKSITIDDEGNLYISYPEARTTSLDREGKIRWTITTPVNGRTLYAESSAMKIIGSQLIALIDGGEVGSFDKDTGQRNSKWTEFPNFDDCVSGRGTVSTNLEIADGKIFVSPDGGSCVDAYDLLTGKQLWQFQAPDGNTLANIPVYVRGVLYVNSNHVWALDANTGKILAGSIEKTYNYGGNVVYDARNDQILTWSKILYAFKPVK